ncbi:MAG: efflux RND transporter periplasmic adaptor subunit [Pseudomonadota bacterium]
MKTNSRNLSHILSLTIVVAVALWMASGLLGNDPEASAITATETASAEDAIQQVRVQQFDATEVAREVVVSGRTEPNRMVEVRAETDGTVISINAERGAIVAAGAPLLTLDIRDRNARLAEAAALVAQRELEYKATQNLRGQQFTTEVQIADVNARLESAKATHEKIKLEIRNTVISAPFDGVVQERSVEIGDFVRIGDTVLELVDLDPLIISGEVNEREISELIAGGGGIANLSNGSQLTGTIRYLAPVADTSTRSFNVELAVPNPDNTIRAGLTSDIHLYADVIKVHTLSAGLLSLADDGTIGVKIVDNQDTVRFYPVEIAGTSTEGTQVTGLPDSIRLITVGQGFVTEGQKVNPVTVSSPESAASYERAD